MAKKIGRSCARIENRKARYDFQVIKEFEVGIALRGNEVKSLQEGKCSIKDAYCYIDGGQLWIKGMHISKWFSSNDFDVDEDREKILLARKSEIRQLAGEVKQMGYTIVPLLVYKPEGCRRYKVRIALCKGKKLYDKRESMKNAQVKRDIERVRLR